MAAAAGIVVDNVVGVAVVSVSLLLFLLHYCCRYCFLLLSRPTPQTCSCAVAVDGVAASFILVVVTVAVVIVIFIVTVCVVFVVLVNVIFVDRCCHCSGYLFLLVVVLVFVVGIAFVLNHCS